MRRDLHEVPAVVVGLDVHAGRQDAILPDVIDLRVDALEGRLRLAAVAHEDDALHHVGVVVVAHDAEPRREADVDVGHVPDAHRGALLGRHHDVLDVALRRRARAEEADAADVVALLAHEQPIAADVLVRVLDRRDDLAERHVLGAEPEGVDLHVVLLGLAAVARDVDDALHLLELALEHPVLRGLQILEGVSLADDAVAEHLADRVPGR